jgi:hypothetical protein
MKFAPALIALTAVTGLAACGGGDPAENTADQLEAAADQSTPEAADVLDNAADRIEEGETGNASATAQEALNQAGNAQMGTSPPEVTQPIDNSQ